MFYYYGRKRQTARHYPDPYYSTIIEPFAGSAAYSLFDNNWKKEIILIEKDKRVADIWKWLIHDATPDEISRLPDYKVGEKSSDFLVIVHAVTKMAFKYKTIKITSVLERNWEISKRFMAANLHKVKHWKIICGDYTEAPDIEATWFIDPPYKSSPGLGYDHGSHVLNYEALAAWVKTRKGEVICCEGEFGDYLPFKPLRDQKGVAGKSSREVIYYRTARPQLQMNLFSNELATEKSLIG